MSNIKKHKLIQSEILTENINKVKNGFKSLPHVSLIELSTLKYNSLFHPGLLEVLLKSIMRARNKEDYNN